MIMIKRDIIVGIIFLAVGSIGSFVYAAEQKITVCHATHSSTNPYVMIKVAASALSGLDHVGDFIPAPGATDCIPLPPPPVVGGVR